MDAIYKAFKVFFVSRLQTNVRCNRRRSDDDDDDDDVNDDGDVISGKRLVNGVAGRC